MVGMGFRRIALAQGLLDTGVERVSAERDRFGAKPVLKIAKIAGWDSAADPDPARARTAHVTE